ncbi:MAG: IS110 family transposase [Saccharofermentanales bacterium]|jgi:transposase
MIYVGIDVAKAKHDCCILSSDGSALREPFTFANDQGGFDLLMASIVAALQEAGSSQIKAGLEATGHYSENLVAFLRSSGIEPVVLNPLQVNLYRKSQTLRKTKTDKVDARCIAQLLMTAESGPAPVSYQIQELKTLTRHRSRLVARQTKLKVSISRLVDILFPELPSICCFVTQASIKAVLLELPSAREIAACRIDRLTNLLRKSSKGRYGGEKALQIKALAKSSIGSSSPATALELQFTLQQLNFIQQQIARLDKEIRDAVLSTKTPLLSIPGIGPTLAAIILAEIGDIQNFSSPDKLQAFAGLDPSTYQSGKFKADKTPMVKHGSTYLRWALMQAARLAALNCETFRRYLELKRAQGKHYFVALGHTAKKLIRVIFHILNTNEVFVPQT